MNEHGVWCKCVPSECPGNDTAVGYTGGMHEHDGYQPHSHEVRPDHLGVPSSLTLLGGVTRMEPIKEQLKIVHNLVADMGYIDGQDRELVLEMSQVMISDLISYGELKPIGEYIRRYNDITDTREEVDQLIRELTTGR